MQPHYLHQAAIALALLAGTGVAQAQTVITRQADTVVTTRAPALTSVERTTVYRTIVPRAKGRRPIVHERIVRERLAPAAPVVREQVVTQPARNDYSDNDYYDYAYVPQPPAVVAPLVDEPLYSAPQQDFYSAPQQDYAYVPAPRSRDIYAADYAYAVGSRVPQTVPLANIPDTLATRIPAVGRYQYMVINNRLLLVDPVTRVVVADVTQ